MLKLGTKLSNSLSNIGHGVPTEKRGYFGHCTHCKRPQNWQTYKIWLAKLTVTIRESKNGAVLQRKRIGSEWVSWWQSSLSKREFFKK